MAVVSIFAKLAHEVFRKLKVLTGLCKTQNG